MTPLRPEQPRDAVQPQTPMQVAGPGRLSLPGLPELPFDLWGIIFRHSKQAVQRGRAAICRAFSQPEFERTLYSGIENQVASLLVSHAMRNGRSFTESPRIEMIARRVTEFRFDKGVSTVSQAQLEELVARFTNLTSISFYGLDLRQVDLRVLGRLPLLTTVDLSSAKLSQDALIQLPENLKTLLLAACQMDDEKLNDLARFTSLKKLVCKDNQILRGNFFAVLSTTLEELDCSSCDIRDGSLPHLSQASSLRKLNVTGNKNLSGENFVSLAPTVEEFSCTDLYLEYNQKCQIVKMALERKVLDRPWLQGFASSVSLTSLHLHDCTSLTAQDIEKLATLFPNVTRLDLSHAVASSNSTHKFLDTAVQAISGFKKLTFLHLKDNPFLTLECLANLPATLEGVGLEGCSFMATNQQKFQAIFHLRQKHPELYLDRLFHEVQRLDLRGNPEQARFCMKHAAKFTGLQELNVSNCQLQDSDLVSLRRMGSLQKLDMSHNPGIQNPTPCFPQNLIELRVSHCSLTNESMRGWIVFRNLTLLDVRNNANLTCVDLSWPPSRLRTFLAEGCPVEPSETLRFLVHMAAKQKIRLADLEMVNLIKKMEPKRLSLENIIDPPLEELAELFPDVEELDLANCTLTDDACKVLGRFSKLKVLKLDRNPAISGKNFPLLATSIERLGTDRCGLDMSACMKFCLARSKENEIKYFGLNISKYFDTRALDLSDSPVSVFQLLMLATRFPNVEYLKLRGCSLNEEHVVAIRQFSRLLELDVTENPALKGNKIALSRLPELALTHVDENDGTWLWHIIQFKEQAAPVVRPYLERRAPGSLASNSFDDLALGYVSRLYGKDLSRLSADEVICLMQNLQDFVVNGAECTLELFRILEKHRWSEKERGLLTRFPAILREFPDQVKGNKLVAAYAMTWAANKWLALNGYKVSLRKWEKLKKDLSN